MIRHEQSRTQNQFLSMGIASYSFFLVHVPVPVVQWKNDVKTMSCGFLHLSSVCVISTLKDFASLCLQLLGTTKTKTKKKKKKKERENKKGKELLSLHMTVAYIRLLAMLSVWAPYCEEKKEMANQSQQNQSIHIL